MDIKDKIDSNNLTKFLNNGIKKTYKDIEISLNIKNFLLENIEWIEYNLNEIKIIELNTGKCVPLHCLNSYCSDNIKIFSYFIMDPQWGHTIALEDSVLYNIKKNTVHEWKNKDEYHFASNCGTNVFYILQIVNYEIS